MSVKAEYIKSLRDQAESYALAAEGFGRMADSLQSTGPLATTYPVLAARQIQVIRKHNDSAIAGRAICHLWIATAEGQTADDAISRILEAQEEVRHV